MRTPSHAGRFVWHELISTDLAAARAFYTGLLGWSIREQDMGMDTPYVLFHHDDLGEDTAGGMAPPMAGIPPHWLPYITVDDVDAAMVRVAALGGTVATPAMDVPGVGRFAVVEDPTGGVFALFRGEQPGASDTTRRPPMRTICWCQLNTTNLDRAVAFYAAVFGWQPAPMGPGMAVLQQGEVARASAMQLPLDTPAPTRWLTYVAVEDCDASCARAIELGATVQVPPTDMPGMGRYAVLADPSGAVFALWRDAQA